jgi:hypothetical protein
VGNGREQVVPGGWPPRPWGAGGPPKSHGPRQEDASHTAHTHAGMAAPTPSRPVRHWVLTSPSTPTAQMLTLTARVPRPPVACQATLASGPRTVRQGVLTARAPAAIDTFAIPLNTPWPSALTACAPLGTNQHRRNIRHRGRCAGRTGHGPVRAGSPSGRPDCRGRVTWARPGPPGSAGGESGARGSDPASPASDHLSQPARLGRSASRRSLTPRQTNSPVRHGRRIPGPAADWWLADP